MGQITATLTKTVKEFLRERAALFWTIAWPILWVLIGSFSFTGNAPEETVPLIRASMTVPMMVFALMVAGMSNVPANIAKDREAGLLAKLMSMPVAPWRDFLGRVLGLLAFSSLAVALVALAGLAVGARFSSTTMGALQSVGFLLLVFLASAGIGMIIGTFIKRMQGAIMTGVGISVVTAAISGVMAPFAFLPSLLQDFAKLYPISSANSSIIYLLAGQDLAGYDPLSATQVALTTAISFSLFLVGLVVYSRYCWRKE